MSIERALSRAVDDVARGWWDGSGGRRATAHKKLAAICRVRGVWKKGDATEELLQVAPTGVRIADKRWIPKLIYLLKTKGKL